MMIEARFAGDLGAFRLDASFEFPDRGVTALFGPSGCGKTSLLRCFAGLNHLPQGKLTIDGTPWQDEARFLPPHRRAVGYVFQDANLFAHLSVRDNLLYGRKRALKKPLSAKGDDVDDLVSLLGIGHLLDRAPANLSGGERQRVAVGRALLAEPRLLLMDEPLSALDYGARQEILPYLERLPKSLSIPILYVTHAPDEVARLADHIVLIDKGRVRASGPVSEIMARLDLPMLNDEDAGVAIEAHIGERDPQWHLARADFTGGSLWIRDPDRAVGAPVRLMIRARDVTLALSPQTDSSVLNSIPAVITDIAPSTHPAAITVRAMMGETPVLSRVTTRSAAELGLAPGSDVWVLVKSVAVLD